MSERQLKEFRTPHQEAGARFLSDRPGTILADEQGW
jgi:hypothetical protein